MLFPCLTQFCDAVHFWVHGTSSRESLKPRYAALVDEKWERSEGVQEVSHEFTSLGTSVYTTKKRSRSLSGSFNFN